jgi:hypothetical protein
LNPATQLEQEVGDPEQAKHGEVQGKHCLLEFA